MGKKGVNKLAKMSDEERARYLQHRADLEEEARRRKRELIARFIKNKLDKEESYSRMNTAKINQEWRYILRRIKCKQMATDIQGMITSFNFMVERKDRLLECLMKAIEDSDDQHRRAFQAHTETLSYFLNIGTQRLDKLQAEYDFQKNTLLENWDKEELEMTESQENAEFKLKIITYIQRRDFQAFKKEKELQRATANNDARLEHEEELRGFSRPKRLEIEGYWSKLREVYNSYLEQHNPIMAHYQSLRKKDDFYRRDIARNDAHIQQATENLMNLQKEWVRTTNTTAMKLKKMANHKEELSKRYWQLKKYSKQELGRGEERLAVLVDASQGAIKRMEEIKEKLDKILQMEEICRKYEHKEDELVKDAESDGDGGEPIEYENLDGAMINECKEYSKMEKFMLKMNRVKVQALCLKTEKAKLLKVNTQLKLYIKRYLTELALRGVDRPLSVKIQGVQKIDAAGKFLNRPVTCIEGVLSNAVQHEKRMKLEKKIKETEKVRAYPRVQCWI